MRRRKLKKGGRSKKMELYVLEREKEQKGKVGLGFRLEIRVQEQPCQQACPLL